MHEWVYTHKWVSIIKLLALRRKTMAVLMQESNIWFNRTTQHYDQFDRTCELTPQATAGLSCPVRQIAYESFDANAGKHRTV